MQNEKFDTIVRKLKKQKNVDGVSFNIASPSRKYSSLHSYGNLANNRSYYIASVNKMILTALMLQHFKKPAVLREKKVAGYFPDGYLNEILYRGNVDAVEALSLYHLLTHTSGLPCYLLDKVHGEKPLMQQLLTGYDEPWPFERVLSSVSKLNPKFFPGTPGRAYYSNTNFRLVAYVLEKETGKHIRTILTDFFHEFGMDETRVVSENTVGELLPIKAGTLSFMPAEYLSSTGYDVYSTAIDQMTFVQDFFGGKIFPKTELQELFHWNRIFFPLRYGMGLQRFDVPRILTPFRPFPPIIGHSGSTGAYCFYIPEKDLYITGAISQAKKIGAGFRAMIGMVNQFR